ncbi:MAG TPA: helix-turn-helix transcriptional regulator [Angustibacter sp.]|nr:helix-turn-helix transcriptional regulator [Angustibacter sp.]
MAGALTPLAVSVLALLAERAMHPYEMYQLLLDRHEDELVKVRPGSLYHTVERLDGLGHVRACGTERSGNRPERTTYEITSTGRAALRWRLLEMLNAPVNEYPEFPVALGEAHNLPADQVVNQLTDRLQALDGELDRLTDLIDQARVDGVPEAYWCAADYLRAVQRAERDWIATLVHRLEHKELAWPHLSKS